MSATGETAAILGATGAVGKALLGELVGSSKYSKVHAFVRRPFKADSAFKDEAKLEEHIVDFDKLVDGGEGAQAFKDVKANAVYVALGTTRALAGSAAQFERVDREYVLHAAKAARLDQEEAQRLGQRLLYCSSSGASSGSPFLYMKSKGLTEEGLASLGYPDCIIFRPGFLVGAERPQRRIMEQAAGVIFSNVVSRFSDEAEIQIPLLARAMLWAGTRGSSGLTTAGIGSPPSDKFKRNEQAGDKFGTVTLVRNSEAKRLAKEE